MNRLLTLIFLLVVAAAMSCGVGSSRCGRGCPGCCTADGVCAAGTDGLACGVGGEQCAVCLGGTACRYGFCVAPLASQSGGGHAADDVASQVDGGSREVLGPDAGDGVATDAGLDGGAPVADSGVEDAGSVDAGFDAGCIALPPPVTCTTDCSNGFVCAGGVCILNGAQGGLQVTLRWNSDEDVDLHVVEPNPLGGDCDVYWGDRTGSGCTPTNGQLDLDSNPDCNLDHVDIENVIFPAAPTPGVYSVRIDHYRNCDVSAVSVPYEVEVRIGNQVLGFCGVFLPTDPGWNARGGQYSGVEVMQFTVP